MIGKVLKTFNEKNCLADILGADCGKNNCAAQ